MNIVGVSAGGVPLPGKKMPARQVGSPPKEEGRSEYIEINLNPEGGSGDSAPILILHPAKEPETGFEPALLMVTLEGLAEEPGPEGQYELELEWAAGIHVEEIYTGKHTEVTTYVGNTGTAFWNPGTGGTIAMGPSARRLFLNPPLKSGEVLKARFAKISGTAVLSSAKIRVHFSEIWKEPGTEAAGSPTVPSTVKAAAQQIGAVPS